MVSKQSVSQLTRNVVNSDCCLLFQHSAALAADAVTVMGRALKQLLINPDVFKDTLRMGDVYNNGTLGIDCDADPLQPWVHGKEIIDSLKRVS